MAGHEVARAACRCDAACDRRVARGCGMNILRRVDPRRSLAAAIGWSVVALAICLTLAASAWLRVFIRSTLLEQHSQRLESAGEHVVAGLETAMLLRLQSVTVVATMLSRDVQRSDAPRLRDALEAVRREVPDLVWIAVTDPDGNVVAATSDDVIGRNVYQYAWASQGLDIAWIEESRAPTEPYLKLTAPVRNADGAIVGVVAGQLGWGWVRAMAAGLNAAPGAWLLIDRDGVVRIGPAGLLGQRWASGPDARKPFDPTLSRLGPDATDLPPRVELRRLLADQPYLVLDTVRAPGSVLAKLGWRIVVVQPADSVAAFANSIHWRVAAVLGALGVGAALAGVLVARRLTRRISRIASSADEVGRGDAQRIDVPAGSDEAARLGTTLDRLLASLQRERDELRTLNAELDQRVTERAEEIRRLALESRDAAVMRERLRLARDLHDTLAHSMMAMLTEIRVLKRLASTQPQQLPDELRRAEQAAREGLQEARHAIDQLRSSPVRHAGLGAALAGLARGFGERSGIDVLVDIDAELAALDSDAAETVFRICEELLRNVARHAGARRVRLALQHDGDGQACLQVSDDGSGFDPQTVGPGHYGLVGLHEQAESIGARLEIDSAPGRGTRVQVRWTPRRVAAAA
jgi:signal transduction histidine kinase